MTSTNAIDFYLSEVDARIAEKQAELDAALKKSEQVREHAVTVQNFLGKYTNFTSRVQDIQQEIVKMDRLILEKQREIDETRNFSKREEIEMAKLQETLEAVSEERKQKERALLRLYEDQGKRMDSSDEEEEEEENVEKKKKTSQ